MEILTIRIIKSLIYTSGSFQVLVWQIFISLSLMEN